jgi:predicted nucleic acid-binding protein
MALFIDTSMLVRQADPLSADRELAVSAISGLIADGNDLVIAAQSIIEFWAVATRPRSANGLGLSVSAAELERIRIESVFNLMPDPPSLYSRWVRLVNVHAVSGKQVHDTRLVAFMLESGMKSVLTFNVADFARFPDVTAIHPANV